MRYLKGTQHYGIKFKCGIRSGLIGYSDSDYSNCDGDGKNTTGHIFYFSESPISRCSQKQSTVALSSCEAEFIAATSAACQALWLHGMLEEVTGEEHGIPLLNVDNQSALALMKNPVFHGRSKHFETKYYFIRDCIRKGQLEVEFVSSDRQKADMLTKALSKMKFAEMRVLIAENFDKGIWN